jgi:hypothetical protein
MLRILALACQLLLSAAPRAEGLSEAGVWTLIVLLVAGEAYEWRAARNLAYGRVHLTDLSCRYEIPSYNA